MCFRVFCQFELKNSHQSLAAVPPSPVMGTASSLVGPGLVIAWTWSLHSGPWQRGQEEHRSPAGLLFPGMNHMTGTEGEVKPLLPGLNNSHSGLWQAPRPPFCERQRPGVCAPSVGSQCGQADRTLCHSHGHGGFGGTGTPTPLCYSQSVLFSPPGQGLGSKGDARREKRFYGVFYVSPFSVPHFVCF